MEYWKQIILRALADTWGVVAGGRLSTLIASVAILCITLAIYKKLAGPEAMRNRLRATASIGMATMLVGFVVFFVNLLIITPRWLYEEQKELAQHLREERKQLIKDNALLSQALSHRKHSIDTTDPVFPNIIYLLQAFRIYRNTIGHDAKCTIYITAPPDSIPAASMVAQFSIATSNCATFGPMGSNLTPSLENEAREGSVPGIIIAHAPEHDKAADKLVNHLNPHFRVKRGYKAIPVGRIAKSSLHNNIWLQFGANTRFSSELRDNDASVKQK